MRNQKLAIEGALHEETTGKRSLRPSLESIDTEIIHSTLLDGLSTARSNANVHLMFFSPKSPAPGARFVGFDSSHAASQSTNFGNLLYTRQSLRHHDSERTILAAFEFLLPVRMALLNQLPAVFLPVVAATAMMYSTFLTKRSFQSPVAANR